MDTERQILSIFHARPLGISPATPIWACDGCGTSSHPELGIIIDPRQLDGIRGSSHVENFSAFLTFVVAHEAAHQRQYALYGKDLYKRSVAVRQYYEAQADILAGMYLYGSGPNVLDPSQSQLLTKALRVIYDLGSEQYALADHPSKSGRFMAARMGMKAAEAEYLSHDPSAVAQAEAASIRHLIDLKIAEDDMSYSLRTARRVVKFNRVAAIDLVEIDKDNKIQYDKSNAHPTVTYDLAYENRGTRPLAVTLQVQSLSVPRDDTQDIFGAIPATANYYTFEIKPKKIIRVRGELRWIATQRLMPMLIFPPDDQGLMEVRYADASDKDTEDLATDQRLFGVDNPSRLSAGARNNISYVFSDYVRASANSFTSLRAGPGSDDADTESITYACSKPLPGAISCEVELPSGGDPLGSGSLVRNRLIRTADVQEAKRTYDQTVALLRDIVKTIPLPVSSPGGWLERPSTFEQRKAYMFSNGEYWVSVNDSQLHGIHSIDVRFNGPPRSLDRIRR
jgi:hypothetical protein